MLSTAINYDKGLVTRNTYGLYESVKYKGADAL